MISSIRIIYFDETLHDVQRSFKNELFASYGVFPNKTRKTNLFLYDPGFKRQMLINV